MMLRGTALLHSYFKPASLLAASAVALSLMGAYSAGPLVVPTLPMGHNAAMIYNPGNGDFVGYRIVVDPSGKAAAVDGAGRDSSELQSDVTQKFFADLAAAGPLDKLPAGDCSSTATADATTVEVNAAVIVTWNGKHTPALTCVTDPRAVRILLDATTIQHAIYVQAYRKRTMMTYGGGYTYKGEGYNQNAAYDYNASGDEGFYIDRFQNASFNFDNFASDSMNFSLFDNEYQARSNGPFTTFPGTGPEFTNLPYANPYSGTDLINIPQIWPFGGGPWSNTGSGASPFSNSPFGQSPFAAGP
jgi:hypothetical protein